jgi:hypothetical protein
MTRAERWTALSSDIHRFSPQLALQHVACLHRASAVAVLGKSCEYEDDRPHQDGHNQCDQCDWRRLLRCWLDHGSSSLPGPVKPQ